MNDTIFPAERPVFKLIHRDEWGPNHVPVARPTHKPCRIVVHHSYSPDSSQFKGDDTIRAISKHHTVNNGWADIAYHYLISPDGSKIYEGRPAFQIGAHCGGTPPAGISRNFGNTGSIGICLIGDYDHEPVNPEGLRTLAVLIADLCERYDIKLTDIYGHCEAWTKPPKTCPGKNLFISLFGENRWKNLKF